MAKICILGTAWPFRGGLAVYNQRLAEALSQEGHEVCIETFTLQYPEILFPGKTQYAIWEYNGNVPILRGVNSVNPINWILTGNRLKKERFDVLIIKYWLPFMAPCLGSIARIVKSNQHTQVISILDNVIPHEHRIGDKILTRYFIKSVNGFIAMSEKVAADLRKFDQKKHLKITPHPLYDNFGEKIDRDEALRRLKLDPKFRYLLFFGLIRDYKGLDLLLEAMANPNIKNKPVRLIVAGEFYSESQKYYQQIENLGIKENVIIFPNFIPDHEVNLYFGAADIVVQPYKSATQSGVTQIAYHFEKPMVVTNVGGLAEIVPNGKVGYVVNVSAEEIANAINDFFTNRKTEDFLSGIREEKNKYSWDRMTETIMNLSKILKDDRKK
ncbi:MAG TPA: glycosyltransferase [Salinivirgaceae bacterium]|nr:glycosyltransferase [Salinivirgaceae bacterium]